MRSRLWPILFLLVAVTGVVGFVVLAVAPSTGAGGGCGGG